MLRRLDAADARAELSTAGGPDDEVRAAVGEILAGVRDRGDAAVAEYTERFDGVRLDSPAVDAAAPGRARASLPEELVAALVLAAGRIRTYHEAQVARAASAGIDADGVSVTEMVRAVDRVGLYVPGGRAAYPSTVLMTAIPAQVAGVAEIALCVPPAADGEIAPVTLAAAAIAGVDEIYRIGGAQAIAALAYGTETIGRVDVIVGPGNAYVDAAKRQVAADGVVGIDSPAGPSELVVLADDTAPVEAIAADLVAQAEHGPGGSAVLVTWQPAVADAVSDAVGILVERGDVADPAGIRVVLAETGRAVVVESEAEALAVVNAIAPEHLEIVTSDPERLVGSVRNAGAVFLGPNAATALGDYVAGANHVLPTGGAARFASALRVDDFLRHIHVVRATEAGVRGPVGQAAVRIARAEGLDAHAHSIEIRAESAAQPAGKTGPQ